MALWVCDDCGAAYSVGAPGCPQCGSADWTEAGAQSAPPPVAKKAAKKAPSSPLAADPAEGGQ